MSLVTWNDGGKPQTPGLVVWIFLGTWVAYFCGGLRLLASYWTPHNTGMVAWWPQQGWAMGALVIAPVILCAAGYAFRNTETPASAILKLAWPLVGFCFIAVGYDSLCRTEVYRDGIVVHQPFRPDRRYGADQIARLEVSCYLGGRGGPDPGMVVTTTDGAKIDVAEQATAWNGPRRADWLAGAEIVTTIARASDLWRVEVTREGQSSIHTGCMRRLAERFPEQDRRRVSALFGP